jgi:hypothetical protein
MSNEMTARAASNITVAAAFVARDVFTAPVLNLASASVGINELVI